MLQVRVSIKSQWCDRPAHDVERTVMPIHGVEWCDGPQCDVSLAMFAEVFEPLLDISHVTARTTHNMLS